MDVNTILILNDDCLDHIFQYFKKSTELLPLIGSVHPRFDAAIERQLHRFPNLEVCMSCPPSYNDEQLQALGRHIQSLYIDVSNYIDYDLFLRILKQLLIGAAKTGKLRRLKLHRAYLYRDEIQILMLVRSSVRELDLSHCFAMDQNNLQLLFRESTQLEKLHIFNTDSPTYDSVLRRLKNITIYWLDGTKLYDIERFSKKYPNLSIVVYRSTLLYDFSGPLIEIHKPCK